MNQRLVFLCLLLLLVVLPVTHSRLFLRRGNDDERKLQQDNDDDKFDKGPKAIADVVLSAIKLGRMDERALHTALQSGFTQEQVNHIVKLAKEKVNQDGNTTLIEADLKHLADIKVPPRTQQIPRNDYVVGKPWTLSYHQQRLISKAVLTAIRSPTKQVDEAAVQVAMEAGVDRELILKSVVSATQHRSSSSSSSSTNKAATATTGATVTAAQ